jgi:hypothetical protein
VAVASFDAERDRFRKYLVAAVTKESHDIAARRHRPTPFGQVGIERQFVFGQGADLGVARIGVVPGRLVRIDHRRVGYGEDPIREAGHTV